MQFRVWMDKNIKSVWKYSSSVRKPFQFCVTFVFFPELSIFWTPEHIWHSYFCHYLIAVFFKLKPESNQIRIRIRGFQQKVQSSPARVKNPLVERDGPSNKQAEQPPGAALFQTSSN